MAAEEPKSNAKMYASEEIAKHNKEEDMWMIVHGKVYDVTKFAEDHPGGPEILSEHAGVDATEAFEEVFHSDAAREQLKDFYLGDLEGYVPKPKGEAGANGGGSNVMAILIALLIAAGVAYKLYAA